MARVKELQDGIEVDVEYEPVYETRNVGTTVVSKQIGEKRVVKAPRAVDLIDNLSRMEARGVAELAAGNIEQARATFGNIDTWLNAGDNRKKMYEFAASPSRDPFAAAMGARAGELLQERWIRDPQVIQMFNPMTNPAAQARTALTAGFPPGGAMFTDTQTSLRETGEKSPLLRAAESRLGGVGRAPAGRAAGQPTGFVGEDPNVVDAGYRRAKTLSALTPDTAGIVDSFTAEAKLGIGIAAEKLDAVVPGLSDNILPALIGKAGDDGPAAQRAVVSTMEHFDRFIDNAGRAQDHDGVPDTGRQRMAAEAAKTAFATLGHSPENAVFAVRAAESALRGYDLAPGFDARAAATIAEASAATLGNVTLDPDSAGQKWITKRGEVEQIISLVDVSPPLDIPAAVVDAAFPAGAAQPGADGGKDAQAAGGTTLLALAMAPLRERAEVALASDPDQTAIDALRKGIPDMARELKMLRPQATLAETTAAAAEVVARLDAAMKIEDTEARDDAIANVMNPRYVTPEPDKEKDKAGEDKAGEDKAGEDKAGEDKAGEDKAEKGTAVGTGSAAGLSPAAMGLQNAWGSVEPGAGGLRRGEQEFTDVAMRTRDWAVSELYEKFIGTRYNGTDDAPYSRESTAFMQYMQGRNTAELEDAFSALDQEEPDPTKMIAVIKGAQDAFVQQIRAEAPELFSALGRGAEKEAEAEALFRRMAGLEAEKILSRVGAGAQPGGGFGDRKGLLTGAPGMTLGNVYGSRGYKRLSSGGMDYPPGKDGRREPAALLQQTYDRAYVPDVTIRRVSQAMSRVAWARRLTDLLAGSGLIGSLTGAGFGFSEWAVPSEVRQQQATGNHPADIFAKALTEAVTGAKSSTDPLAANAAAIVNKRARELTPPAGVKAPPARVLEKTPGNKALAALNEYGVRNVVLPGMADYLRRGSPVFQELMAAKKNGRRGATPDEVETLRRKVFAIAGDDAKQPSAKLGEMKAIVDALETKLTNEYIEALIKREDDRAAAAALRLAEQRARYEAGAADADAEDPGATGM